MTAVHHERALTYAVGLVDGIEDWDAPTPCARWTVRRVVEHLAWGNLVLGGALRGEPYAEPGGGRTVPLAPPPAVSYAATVAAVREELARPGALDGPLAFPAGPLPAADALAVRVQDVVVHCWDLAVAAGRPFRVDDELVAAAERVAVHRRAAGDLAPAHFAPARPGPGTSLTRLLAATGRDPDWSPP